MNKEIGMSSMMDISTGTGMNKPHGKLYFAKYLPVEGGIRQGDKIQDALNNTYVCTNVVNGEIYCSGYKDMVYLPKKVKLFLCSRDIQVGDKWWHNGAEKDRLFDEEDVHDFKEFPDFAKVSFKVIGEISSFATWVKEGDEFEEDELFPMLYCIKHPNESNYLDNMQQLSEWMKLNPKPTHYKVVVEIKGPCGHYH